MPTQDSAAPAAAQNIAALIEKLDLKISSMPTQSLVAHGRKARTHTKAQIQALANIISEIGFIVPIICDEAGKVLAGNARLEAARLLCLPNVPAVMVSHLSDAQKRLFAIADNRLAELAGWDREALAVELEELRNLDVSLDIELTGFGDAQVDGIVASVGMEDHRADLVPLPGPAPISQLGDVWEMDRHRLICGNATDPDVVARLLRGEPVRTVWGDAPYNREVNGEVIRSKGHGEFVMGSGEMTDAQFTAFLAKTWANIEQTLIPGGLAYMSMDWRHIHNMLAALAGKELDLLNLIVWKKTLPGMGGFYRSQHELIFLAEKRGGKHTNHIGFGKSGRSRSNVWDYDSVQGFGAAKARLRELHPTVKPMAMIRDLLLDSSDRGEVVFDPFSGSGTTLIAAEVTGRKGRVVELDPLYADTSAMRWQDYSGKQAVLAATGETFAQVRVRRGSEAAIGAPEAAQEACHGQSSLGEVV